MRIMVTGGLGFIGTNFVKHLVNINTPHEILIVDMNSYASNDYWLKNNNRKITVFQDDICNADFWNHQIAAIIHFAAESHVDNAIKGCEPFIHSNIVGTYKLLEYAKRCHVSMFLYVSTDEVYGCTSLDSNIKFKETDKLNPRNPYSATKAAAEHLCMSYWQTYGLPITITRSCNNFGPYQHDEKFIPTVIRNILKDKPIPVYGKGLNIREWISVEDNCRAILEVFNHGRVGEIYNIGSEVSYRNIDLANFIIDLMGKGEIQFVEDRSGHDLRYALDSSKIKAELEWHQSEPNDWWLDAWDETIEFYKEKYK